MFKSYRETWYNVTKGMIQIKYMILNLCCAREVIGEGSSDRCASITEHDTHI